MSRFNVLSRSITLIALVTPTVVGSQSFAAAATETDNSADTLTTIVVTATRRSTSIQDIPFSINAVGGGRLEQLNVLNVSDLNQLTPEIQVSPGSATNTVIGMRGVFDGNVSTTESAGSDHSVGIEVDGVPAAGNGDASLSQGLYDLDRVEILRGPQGTLFGRNVFGGLISLHSREPSFDPSMSATIGYGNYGAYQAQGYVTGGITNTLAGRFSISSTGDDGYKRNIETAGPQGRENKLSARAQLLWQPNSDLKVLAGGEVTHNTGEFLGAGTLMGNVQPRDTQPLLVPIKAGPWGPAGIYPILDYGQNTVQSPTNGSLLTNNASGFIRADWTTGPVGTVTSVTGYRTADVHTFGNGDITPFASALLGETEHEKQFSQELRIASPDNQRIRYVAGAFYLTSTRTLHLDVPADYSMFAPLSLTSTPAFALALEGGPCLIGLCNTGPVTKFAAAEGSDVDLTSKALFGELNYDITRDLTATVGGRMTWDDRSGNSFTTYDYAGVIEGSATAPAGTQIGTGPLGVPIIASSVLPPGVQQPYPLLSGGPGISAAFERQWSAFTPKFDLSYKPVDGVLVYTTASRGFTAGGFNGNGSNPVALATGFNPEYVWNYEVGTKSTFLEGRLVTNASIYREQFTDLQVDAFNVNCLCILTQNAAKAHSQGLELEAVGRPLKWLKTGVNYVYDEARYDSYPTVDAAGDPVNYKGNTLQNVPKNAVTVYADTTWNIAGRGQIGFDASMSFSSKRNSSAANDDSPLIRNLSANDGVLDLGASWTSETGEWKVLLWGKNVTNQRYLVSALTGLGILNQAAVPPVPDSDIAFVNWNLPPTFGINLTFKQ